jgi:hypothetical protein
MTRTPELNDLLVLLADRNMEATMRGILTRHKALGTRPIVADIRRHPRNDGGCCGEGVQFLAAFAGRYSHALLLFDREGCGREGCSAVELELELEAQLKNAGWSHRAGVIVLDPELEIWVWSDSPHVDDQLGWAGRKLDLRSWLRKQRLLRAGQPKPDRPKEALEAALRNVKLPRSSAIYKALAEKVSLGRCNDRAFVKLKTILRSWFAET